MSSTDNPASGYHRRVVDAELDELLESLAALSLEGPKAVGKTSTARRRGGSIVALDDPGILEVIQAQSSRLLVGDPPIVIDEWQRYPASWDVVRRAVDEDHSAGRFILTGSATPPVRPTHSGAGRIVAVRMRPLSFVERGVEPPTVSLAAVLSGGRPNIEGATEVTLESYTSEILVGGFPGIRFSRGRAQRAALDGYLLRILDTELPELGVEIRRPATLLRWLRAYAAATSSSASWEKIRDAATSGEDTKPAKTTVGPYREALERIWILDPLPAWVPTANHLSRLTAAPKHHLADPALAARLVGVTFESLLRGGGPQLIRRDGTFLGALFESLAALSVRVLAQASEATVSHLRTRGGEREIDLVVSRGDGCVVGVEVKLSETVEDADVRHLLWLRHELGDEFLDGIVVTTGRYAYRRGDGIGVVPLALLGP